MHSMAYLHGLQTKGLVRRVWLLLLLITPGLFGQSLNGYLAWKAIPGSHGYHLQIRNQQTRQVIVDQIVESTRFKIDLPLGSYENRTAPLNRFGKPMVWSYWRNLEIATAPQPKLSPPKMQMIGDAWQFEIQGKGLLPATRYYFEQKDKQIPVKSSQRVLRGDQLIIRLPGSAFSPGPWDLVAVNPGNKVERFSNVISVTEGQAEPVIATVSTNDQKTDPTDQSPAAVNGVAQYRQYVRQLKRSCKASSLPDVLIKRCFENHVTLYLESKDNRNLYSFILLESQNISDRMQALQYYQDECPVFKPAQSLVQARLQERARWQTVELQRMLAYQAKKCP
ncbi:MAG: hypothetical protein KDK39_10485 [Leptospiraceae bacterium]|nr:hypothetical protein [Leptospiraceae bacterium]